MFVMRPHVGVTQAADMRSLSLEEGHERSVQVIRLGKVGRTYIKELQRAQVVRIKIEAVSLESTSIKVHPDATGALKNSPQAIGKSRGGRNTKIHTVAVDARTAMTFYLSQGQAHAPPGGAEPA